MLSKRNIFSGFKKEYILVFNLNRITQSCNLDAQKNVTFYKLQYFYLKAKVTLNFILDGKQGEVCFTTGWLF